MHVIRTLLEGIVDYAGLFPPAALAMEPAVRDYADYLAGPDAWMLGRFIVPAARLDEFAVAAETLLPRNPTNAGWRLSALVGNDAAEDVAAIGRFNCHHAAEGAGAAAVDTVELKVENAATVEAIMAKMPSWLMAFLEIPIAADPEPLVTMIGRAGARAKVRTGGVTADAFPAAEPLARFLEACVRHRVPFKATAGLHHPVRAEHALTYASDAPRGTMHGFLNVFLATAALAAGHGHATAVALLEESSPAAFHVEDDAVIWRDLRLDAAELAAARRLGLSFGSCSFREPIDDLTTLELL